MKARITFPLFISILATCISTNAQNKYFPEGALREGRSQWYSRHLKALKEPPLYTSSKIDGGHAYRFTWLRSFDHPLAVRLRIERDGTGVLIVKVASGAGGYEPGRLKIKRTLIISRKQVADFVAHLEKAKFWDIPTSLGLMGGQDGARWIMEGVKGGHYQLVDRWSPESGEYRETALFLIQLARLNIKKIY